MTYEQSIQYIKKLEKEGHTPNHQNSVNLMKYLGDIQDSMPVIHVAGTNGKGSTISFLKNILIEAGYSVGTFMSPHFFNYRELIEDNSAIIDENPFASAVTTVKEACDKMTADGLSHPTVFECLVAAALVHLHKMNHDFVIIEVGLGGLEDATNVFTKPLMSIITPISYDHEAVLGDTIEEIARHKAGIAKKGTPLLVAANPIEAISAISSYVREIDGFMYLMDEGLIHTNTFVKTKEKKIFSIKTPFFEYRNLHTSMLGRHQEINIATALLAVDKLRKKFEISNDSVYTGIKKTTWACRNELLSVEPLILLDGGHNPSGMEALSALIDEHYSDYKVITVFGVMADKAHEVMCRTAAAFSDEIIYTRPDDSVRGLDPTGLSYLLVRDGSSSDDLVVRSLSDSACPIIVEPDMEKALIMALDRLTINHLLLVTGSLSLTHPAKVWLNDRLKL